MVELALLLELDDSTHRNISSQFSAEFIERLKSGCDDYDDELDVDNRHRHSVLLASSTAEYLEYMMCESPFEDKLRRVTEHLAHELVDHGLINPADRGQVAELFFNSILAQQEQCSAVDGGDNGLLPPPSSFGNANFIKTSPECLNDDIFT